MKNLKPKILIVTGTRPDTIKMAPLILKLKKNNKFDTKFLVTGQHKELLDQALDVFKLKPDFNLKVMKKGQSTKDVHIRIIEEGEKFLEKHKVDLVLVHGDTMTAHAFSYIAFLKKIEVAHVEAGLRTFDLDNPFPEEAIRQIIDVYAKILYIPTKYNLSNLHKKSLKNKQILVTGNTIVDALKLIKNRPEVRKKHMQIKKGFKNILVTLHRRESFGKDLENIFDSIKKSAIKHKEAHFIIPVHPNPNVKIPIHQMLDNIENISLIDPISYYEMLSIMKDIYFIITDSGGIQEEAPSFNKPVLVARKVTERPEGIKTGILKLVGTDGKKMYKEIDKYILNQKHYQKISNQGNPYGDGKASDRIIKHLTKYFEL